MVTLSNLFILKGHFVTLIILDPQKGIFYDLDPAVDVIQHPLSFGITQEGNMVSRKINLLTDIRSLGESLSGIRSTHIIATEYQFAIAAFRAGANKKAKIMLWEHHHYGALQKNFFWKLLSRIYFKKLDAIICLNESEREYYLQFNKRAYVIPNFISIPEDTGSVDENKSIDLLSVTRYNHIKGIDLLMKIAKKLLANNKKLCWKIIGYGEEETQLFDFIKNENLENQLIVEEAGKQDLTDEYRQAKLFVMTSRNECFPFVLLESMSNGLPAIAFDCPTGPRHIIQHEKTGLLIENGNIELMTAAIEKLLHNKDRLKQMSESSLLAVQQYTIEPVYQRWAKILE